MEIHLNTLTPLWTGGVKGEVDRLHETGIIGSMRWWFEVLVRGYGGEVCGGGECDESDLRGLAESAQDGRRIRKDLCVLNVDEYEKAKGECIDEEQGHLIIRSIALRKAGLCDVCQVFGATGWRRRFRIELIDQGLFIDPCWRDNQSSISYSGRNRAITPSWPTKGPGLVGSFTLRLTSRDRLFDLDIISGLVKVIADIGAIGSKTHPGFGVIHLNNRQRTESLLDHLQMLRRSNTYPALPSLTNMFFASAAVNTNTNQETFDLLYTLRRCFSRNQDLRHFIFGTISGKRQAAKVKVSRPYKVGNIDILRVWGWLPDCPYPGSSRNSVLNVIHKQLSGTLFREWREFNSGLTEYGKTRDSQGAVTDPASFLKSLLSASDEVKS